MCKHFKHTHQMQLEEYEQLYMQVNIPVVIFVKCFNSYILSDIILEYNFTKKSVMCNDQNAYPSNYTCLTRRELNQG